MNRALLVFALTLTFSLPTGNPVVATDGVLYIDSDYLQGYDRKLFKNPIDEDRDGCDTRAEVLIEEAVTKPKINKKCALTGGKWISPYDNKTHLKASALEVDHTVPLKEAWRSGAWKWTSSQREAFANDLMEGRALVAVTLSVNRSKRDKDVANWLPKSNLCDYVKSWLVVKTKYSLSVDSREASKLSELIFQCNLNYSIVERNAITPTPTPTPTPDPPTMSKTEKLWSKAINGVFPIDSEKYPIPKELATTWQNAYDNRDGIPYQAWSAVSKNIASSSSNVGSVEILIGPNTVPNFSDFKLRMDLVSKALPKARNVSKLRLFAFNYRDADWADATFKRLYINETAAFKNRHKDAVTAICFKEREVCFQQAFVDSNLDGVIFIGMTELGSREQLNQTFADYSRAYRGVVIGHEYLHTIQRVVLGERWFQQAYNPPSWFNEGMAVFMENAAANSATFDEFMRFRSVESAIMYPDCPYSFCVKIEREQVQSFLSIYNYSSNWSTYPYAMRYQMSARIIEILVALKGPDSLIEIYEYMATEKTFEQAFERIYGISYESVKPIITSIIVDQIASGK